MPSRKTVLLGAGALVLVVFVAVLALRGGGGPSPKVERGDGSAFPLRGSLADDGGAIDDALDAWKDGPGAAGRAARVSDAEVHVLYAGTIGDRDTVIVRQGSRLIAMHQPLHRGWVVGAAQEEFDPVDGSPVTIDDVVLLPAGGDWTYLPFRPGAARPRTVDGLIASGSAYGGDVDDGLVVEASGSALGGSSKVFDPKAGAFRVDAATRRALLDAARRPGRLTAIHAALGDGDEQGSRSALRSLDVLWTGRLPGARAAAVVVRDDPHRLGLGLVRDPDGLVSSAASVDLGTQLGPLSAHRRDLTDESYVGAAYVGGGDQPEAVLAAATGKVERIELLAGRRRLSRPGPVAVVPVDWEPGTTDVVVFGRTASGEAIAPLVPLAP